jgi:LmbE family N-acetylglucosaminyl deacetylase
MHSPLKVLVLAPHTDDEALGCGGAIARHIHEGDEVHTIAFSTCGRKDLSMEARAASRALGSTIDIKDFEVRRFDRDRHKILDLLIALREKEKPDIVYLPCSVDIHQDHEVVHKEGFRAFKNCTVLGYELPWNCRSFETGRFTRIDPSHLEAKKQAIAEYKSQAHRPYCCPVFTEAQARFRGLQAGTTYAEAFEVIRTIQ